MRDGALDSLRFGLQTDPLPEHPNLSNLVPHAPRRNPGLSEEEAKLAVRNALRYFPESTHEILVSEFAEELKVHGHIYMYRFRPVRYEMKAYPIEEYPAKSVQAAAIMLMIMNNLDPQVAQFPHELVTYGGNGSVFSNWAQYHIVMQLLSNMTEDQTLCLNSGHPLGLFPSHKDAPRVVISNGMMVPKFSTLDVYDKLYATGNTIYGQMTAGSFCYIGPQGIVHGTMITLLNAGRKYLGTDSLNGNVYVSSGLGGMSGAQGKAADICGAISVIAEIDERALRKRLTQGWISEVAYTPDECIQRIHEFKATNGTGKQSIGFLGNVVDLWEALASYTKRTGELLVDLGSDQTSLHNPYNGGYYPVGLTLRESTDLMTSNPTKFKELVHASLIRHVEAVNTLTKYGMRFWDYGNSFLYQASIAGAKILKEGAKVNSLDFRYPSYFEDIMGDIFSLGFGPFRWVCTSQNEEDLKRTDSIAIEVLNSMIRDIGAEKYSDDDDAKSAAKVKEQLQDNLRWVRQAYDNQLVVGSQARILYSDSEGRRTLAKAFNNAVASGLLSSPVVLSRDHHDVSGTDAPFRETANIDDGSMITADMATQNCIGLGFRGVTYLALHNGGGTGWGNATNGGFGLVLDGSTDALRRSQDALFWDVNNGVARRSWARNRYAMFAAKRAMQSEKRLEVTIPHLVKDSLLDNAASAIFCTNE